MFFQTNIPHIKKAVETLSTRQPGDTHDNTAALTAQCKAGLQLLLRNPQSYDTHVTAPSPFTDHFLEALAQLPHPGGRGHDRRLADRQGALGQIGGVVADPL